MIEPKEIIRENRKTLSLTVNRLGELIVKAPKNLPEAEIFKFITQKEKWIESNIKKCSVTNSEFSDYIDYSAYLLFGKKYQAKRTDGIKSANFLGEYCIVPSGLETEQEIHKVVLVYKRLASKWLRERTEEIAKVIGAEYTDFRISDTKGRWGACNSKKIINLNFRVVCLPPALIDYVIVHELCHLKEMNHSQRFWLEVEKILPDYKRRKKAVKDYGFLFQIYNG